MCTPEMLRSLGGALVVVSLIAGCSSVEVPGSKIDYKSTSKLPPLEVPPDLTRPSGDDRFVVPDANPRGAATFSAYSQERTGEPRATRAGVLPSQENARIDRAGNQRWLVVKGSPDAVWPAVRDFWQEAGFIVNVEMPAAGIMETDWAENRAHIPQSGLRGFFGRVLDSVYETSERDKFRTRLERGQEPGTTEIYISHRGMEEVFTSSSTESADTRWQPRPPNPELEAEMLGRLMVRFGVEPERAKTQLAKAAAPLRASLAKGAAGSMLTLTDEFDRAWRRVGLALDRVGFTVEDRDRSKGLYFVRYIDPDADNKTGKVNEGWLSKFKFWGSDKKATAEQYRIMVKAEGTGTAVNVLNKEGAAETSDTANRILTLLYEQLK